MKVRGAAATLFFLLATLGCSQNSLPLVSLPAEKAGDAYVAILISGDGGWAHIDKELAHQLGQDGVPTLGLNSLRYFWFARTQSEIGLALKAMLGQAEKTWPQRDFILIGFSRGANVLPFMVEELPAAWRQRIARIALLSPAKATNFEFRLRDWWTNRPSPDALPLLPALEKLKGFDLLCLYGQEDEETICPDLEEGMAKVIAFPGGHHLHNEYSKIGRDLLAGLPGIPPRHD
ncbi:MAG: AcvB/VirJ family lysyl-phosphatidylglycerol hydrolase [Myxococcota bacterium]|nr:AcvB/VirJ family lysyl-phosphatidylglycerol hydrolase [Myxococcota bacterium]